jgi:hypothetical protein
MTPDEELLLQAWLYREAQKQVPVPDKMMVHPIIAALGYLVAWGLGICAVFSHRSAMRLNRLSFPTACSMRARPL